MKRRSFGVLAPAGIAMLAALKSTKAFGQTANNSQDATLLQTTLTPMGGERAGNADGSIPSWTGGYTKVPDGFKPGDYIGELFPDEAPVVVIDANNMAQHSDRLSEGAMAMMTKYGFSVKVYPTHRTACAPQGVYDAIAANVGRAQLDPRGGRLGFTQAFGGIPFPIPDTTDPLVAGAQIIWNHNTRWEGYATKVQSASWSVSAGQPVLAIYETASFVYPYYQATSLSNYNGMTDQLFSYSMGPQDQLGQELLLWAYSEPYERPQAVWELLNGEGRVRRAPEVSFDTPSTQANGICNYDEYHGFNGSLEKYDWKCLGKKEVYIPYNNNKLYGASAQSAHLAHFIDPDLVRFELHRCWVVEATLHPGERNVLARRRYYVNEDTFVIAAGDMWDANGNLVKTTYVYNCVRPELPGVVYGNQMLNNLQTDDYVSMLGVWDQLTKPGGFLFFDSLPKTTFDPTNMAADAQY